MRKSWLFILTIVTSLMQVPLAHAGDWETLRDALEIDRCDRTTEVSYRSQVLRSPSGNTTVYSESVYRKQGLRGGLRRIGITCHNQNSGGVQPQTTSQRIVIQTGSNLRFLNLNSTDDAYVILTPLSFSPDGNHVVFAEIETLTSGGIVQGPIVIHLQNSNDFFRPACNADHCRFDGFTSNTNFLLKGSPLDNPSIVNVQNESQQEVRFASSGTSYGTTTSPGEVTKVQHFPLPGQEGRAGQRPEPLSINSPLTLTGIGPIQIGMTVAEAQEAAGIRLNAGPAFETNPTPASCRFYSPANLDGVSFMVINHRIVRVDIDSSRFSTLSGAKVGNSKSQIFQIYPNNVRRTSGFYSGGEILTYFPDDAAYQNYRMIFEVDQSDIVRGLRSGKLPEVEYIEGCV